MNKKEPKFIESWRSYNSTRDLFYTRKVAIAQARYKANIMEKVIQWLEVDSCKNFETVFKMDIPFVSGNIESHALQEAWLEVISDLTQDGFNMNYCHADDKHYHLILKIVSDKEEVQLKKKVRKIIKSVKKSSEK